MTATDSNPFYQPRELSGDTVLLLQTDVLARNGLLAGITSKPSDNLLSVRQQSFRVSQCKSTAAECIQPP